MPPLLPSQTSAIFPDDASVNSSRNSVSLASDCPGSSSHPRQIFAEHLPQSKLQSLGKAHVLSSGEAE